MKKFIIMPVSILVSFHCFSQNVGIGTAVPQGKLHIVGNSDISQLVIDANSTQSNTQPLIRLRNSAGIYLMDIHSDNTENAFIGRDAGRVNDATGGGINNVFIGTSAGYNNTTGAQNTTVGRGSLFYNNTGNNNTSVGYKALFSNTTGDHNTAVGAQALQTSSLSDYNTAVGSEALFLNTLGINNTAIGAFALYFNTTAGLNLAVGTDALLHQSFSNGGVAYNSYNTAIGIDALATNNPDALGGGVQNTATGYEALYDNTTGAYNTATGNKALFFNQTGWENTANGSYALYNNQVGQQNTAMGFDALYNNQTGDDNTAVGTNALKNNNSGSFNTAIGYFSNLDLTNSSDNTLLGAGAHIQGNNDVAIGRLSFTNVNNLALLGSATTAQCGGYANWSNFSDGRFKTDVDENVKGLDFIMRLRPVTYHMNVRAIYHLWGISPYGNTDSLLNKESMADIDRAIANKESIRMTGFIAQEVEKAADESAYDFDGVIKPAHDKDHYRLAYGEFVVPLVKAVQEQQKIIEEQKQMIGKQQRIINEIQDRLNVLEYKMK